MRKSTLSILNILQFPLKLGFSWSQQEALECIMSQSTSAYNKTFLMFKSTHVPPKYSFCLEGKGYLSSIPQIRDSLRKSDLLFLL